MEEADLKLDGNAAAGLLAEIFSAEMTVSWATCAHCGAEDQIGRLAVYLRAPGTVLRCTVCSKVVLTIVEGREKLWVDLSGIQRLVLGPSAESSYSFSPPAG